MLKQILYGFCVAGISAALVSCDSDDAASAGSDIIASSASTGLPAVDPASSSATATDTVPAGTSSASVLPSSASVLPSSASVLPSSASVLPSSASVLPSSASVLQSSASVEQSSAAVEQSSAAIAVSSSAAAPASSSSAVPAITYSSSSQAVAVPAEKTIVLEVTDHDDYEKGGPFKTEQITGGAHDGDIIVMPENLTADPNKMHGVIIWGPGGGT